MRRVVLWLSFIFGSGCLLAAPWLASDCTTAGALGLDGAYIIFTTGTLAAVWYSE